MAKRTPKVITFNEPGTTGLSSVAGHKRSRTEAAIPDVERDAYLRGSTAMVIAASAGRLVNEERPMRPRVADDKKIQVSFDDIFKSVQSLGASSFTGKEKKVWEAKQLNALGANIKHKEKMPFKMYLGVAKARKEREEKRTKEEKTADLITGRKAPKKERREFVAPYGQPDSLTPDNVRGPVMYIKKSSRK